MATNIYRFISNFRKDPHMNKLISALGSKFPVDALGANTPLPNQVLETASHNGTPTCLYFDADASRQLDMMRNLAQEKSHYRLKHKKEDKPIEFLCLGYKDHAGDIVIHNIFIPAVTVYAQIDSSQQYLKEQLFRSIPSKNVNLETTSRFYDYLRNTNLDTKYSIGLTPVALIGTTKPIVNVKDGSQYCPRFGEIAKSIVPGNITFNHDIISGVLTISPKYKQQTPQGHTVCDGSLECVLIDYQINKNGTATPKHMTNVVRCQKSYNNQNMISVDISKSYQPIDDLPNASNQLVK